ncbi:phosphoribosylglycinamide formyltransferase [Paenibacillus medicaginis]|uniref:Phosphoribosylglycinamide formyltransferase n=1 Tax=Paenibacillus medicaginis TaxID=1470560 RepID=A0ABV5C5V2_9BACL
MGAYRVAVFASGQGSNFQALVDAAADGRLGGAEVKLLVSDKPAAAVVGRAQAAGIECYTFQPKNYATREDYEQELVSMLREKEIDLVVLAGYMRLLTSVMVEAFTGRIINIHPSLLPAFPGKDAIGQALHYGVKLSGVTVHFVDGGMDTGPIIAQRAVPVTEEAAQESLTAAIQAEEKALYPEVVSWFAERRVKLEGRKVTVIQR